MGHYLLGFAILVRYLYKDCKPFINLTPASASLSIVIHNFVIILNWDLILICINTAMMHDAMQNAGWS